MKLKAKRFGETKNRGKVEGKRTHAVAFKVDDIVEPRGGFSKSKIIKPNDSRGKTTKESVMREVIWEQRKEREGDGR